MKKLFLIPVLLIILLCIGCNKNVSIINRSELCMSNNYVEENHSYFVRALLATNIPIFRNFNIPNAHEILNNYTNTNSIKKSIFLPSTKQRGWFYQPKKDGTPSGEPKDVLELLNKYSAYYLGDTSKKYLYLTFDEGYENGYTTGILDVLKKYQVKAAFFVVKPYITSNTDIIKRMVAEGHLVCNHSTNHPSMAGITNVVKFNNELIGVEEAYEEIIGTKMPMFFRPPMGKYSELSLKYTAEYGYKTVFWSFAYSDWDPKKQPTQEYAKRIIKQRTHNGAIILLHAVSKTNSEIFEDLIIQWINDGFEFKSLNELT